MAEVTRAGLSEEQRAVVDCDDRAIVVRAGAGSGKTEVVAQRVERLLSAGTQGFRVLALSYTRRAAGELRDRFRARLSDAGRRVETDTLHGFAQGLLLQYGTWIGLPAEPEVVVSDVDRVELLQAWRSAQGREPLADARERLLELDLFRAKRESSDLLEEWTAALADAGALDYEAMLQRATELLEVPGVRTLVSRLYRHVIVDEAQNLTASQCVLLSRLIGAPDDPDRGSAMLVGDDKQSIVGFAGASATHMSRFAERYGATEFSLTHNYRSAEAINELSAAVAGALGDPRPDPQTYAAPGSVTAVDYSDEQAEAAAVAGWVGDLLSKGLPGHALVPGEDGSVRDTEIAVLGRSTASLRACQRALQYAGVAIAIASHPDDWLTSDLGKLSWDVGTFRPQSAVSRRRIGRAIGADGEIRDREELRRRLAGTVMEPLTGLCHADTPAAFVAAVEAVDSDDPGWFEDQREILAAWADFCDAQALSDRTWPQFELFVTRWQRGDDAQPGVRLHTVHKAQGREFRAVVVIGLNDGQFPDFRANDDETSEAELRAFYVAVTRPSRVLRLTRPRSTLTRYGPRDRTASRFLRFTKLVGV